MMTYTDEFKRLKGGPLLKYLIQNMKDRRDKIMDERRKFFMYSAHDTVRKFSRVKKLFYAN